MKIQSTVSDENLPDLEEMFRERHERRFNAFLAEIQRVIEWFQTDFPEADIRFELNMDNIERRMVLRLRLLSGKEATPENQSFIENYLVITEEMWNETDKVDEIIMYMFTAYKDAISRAMNLHYNTEKAKRVIH